MERERERKKGVVGGTIQLRKEDLGK
uniref:Uncharacterized protein n=1 Tax=Arundo donax TaxID=35708 RepID=A0A0A9C4Z0_ARUDO